jgi:hypothetical protein
MPQKFYCSFEWGMANMLISSFTVLDFQSWTTNLRLPGCIPCKRFLWKLQAWKVHLQLFPTIILFKVTMYILPDDTVARHIFQACPVWIHTQSNITNIIFTWVHNTNTANHDRQIYFCQVSSITLSSHEIEFWKQCYTMNIFKTTLFHPSKPSKKGEIYFN